MNATMPPQYRNQYQNRVQQSPHVRRGQAPIPTPLDRQKIAAEAQQPHLIAQEQAKAADAAKTRAMKPTDKTMPEGVEDLIVGDGVQQYKQLREVERKLDAVMMRKKLDLQDSLYNSTKRYSTLRIWISNTVENQPWQGRSLDEDAFDFNMGVEATYKVKIEGRLVEDEDQDNISENQDNISEKDSDDDENADGDAMDHDHQKSRKPSTPIPSRKRTKLSHFFKAITVDFDRNRNLQPDGTTQIEWKKTPVPLNTTILPPAADFDCLEFERKSDENINCTINFYRDETPERFALSKELAELLDTTEDDRASILMGIWEYIKLMGLQQDEEKRLIRCDDRLRAIFKVESIFFPQIPNIIHSHLSPLPPLSLPYTIRVDPDHHATSPPLPTIYTLTLPTTDPLPPPPSFLSTHTLRALAAQDDHLALLIQALNASNRKHAFLASMAKDPVGFVKRWMGSQRRDLEIILGEGGRFQGEWGTGERGLRGEWRRGGALWGGREVSEAVGVMVGKAR